MNINRPSRKDRGKVRFCRPEHFPVLQGAWKNHDADPRACRIGILLRKILTSILEAAERKAMAEKAKQKGPLVCAPPRASSCSITDLSLSCTTY